MQRIVGRMACAIIALLLTTACGRDEVATAAPDAASGTAATPVTGIDPPAEPGAMAPNLAAGDEGLYLTWLEPAAGGDGEEKSHRLLMARLLDERWSEPAEVTSGPGFFANWADIPGMVEGPGGALFAYWLAKLGEGTYAYGVHLARSTDGGVSWSPLGLLHDDDSPTEHGFVSMRAAGKGVTAVWLDGRATARGEPMQLRATRILPAADAGGAPTIEPSSVVVPSVCDCCPTAMAVATDGPVVAYRGRTEDEVRDIAAVRVGYDGWSEPATVHDDGWKLWGCPVNGPAVHADGMRVAVAWFTAARAGARVQVAFSEDGGASFGVPIVLDGDGPIGRVDIAGAGGGDDVWVSWMAKIDGNRGAILLARIAPSGTERARLMVTETSTSRAAGVPRLARHGKRLAVVWVEDAEPSTLRAALVTPPR